MPDLAELLPETLEGRAGLIEKFDTVEALAANHIELKSQFDSRAFLPEAGAPPEAMAAFNKRFGVPESAAGYATPSGTAEQMTAMFDGLKETALDKGMNSSQWDAIAAKATEIFGGQVKEAQKVVTDAQASWQAAAQAKYGDKFSEKAALAQRFLDKVKTDDPSFGKVLEATGVMDHPEFVDFAVRAGETVGHGRTPDMSGEESATETLDIAKHVQGMIELDSRKAEIYEKNNFDPRLAGIQIEFAKRMEQLCTVAPEGFSDPLVLKYVDPAAAQAQALEHREAQREADVLASGGLTSV